MCQTNVRDRPEGQITQVIAFDKVDRYPALRCGGHMAATLHMSEAA